MAKFSLPADLVKAIAKFYSEIGPTIYLKFSEGVARFIVLDAAKTALAVTEVEPSVIMDESEGSASFDADIFKRIASVLKREETTFDIQEDKIIISAEGDITKRFEIPISAEEPPNITRELLLQRLENQQYCIAIVTSEFLREAVNTLKKTIKPDTITITVEPTRVVITAPSALHKSEIVGVAGSANVQEITCTEEVSQFFPLDPIEAFAKNVKGALVRMYIGPKIPLILDAELALGAYVMAMVSPRSV